VDETIMPSEDQRVAHVPVGFGTAFQALEPGSRLLVFADYGIEHAKNDDYTYPATRIHGSQISQDYAKIGIVQ